jgi:hypothetical protein
MRNNWDRYTGLQKEGSEFGGIDSPRGGVQPKGADALSAAEKLRLFYSVGDITDTLKQTNLSLDDRRQMLGLKPAGDLRPNWLANTGRVPRAEIELPELWPDALQSPQDEV